MLQNFCESHEIDSKCEYRDFSAVTEWRWGSLCSQLEKKLIYPTLWFDAPIHKARMKLDTVHLSALCKHVELWILLYGRNYQTNNWPAHGTCLGHHCPATFTCEAWPCSDILSWNWWHTHYDGPHDQPHGKGSPMARTWKLYSVLQSITYVHVRVLHN